ncbi:MAG: tRNA threonylcarbamoyladenosine dehydratase, partial [Clostridia bacterium]|nr:tRNA threonylcarbamoyladenosine dehydratase [Clostridia bacterium]
CDCDYIVDAIDTVTTKLALAELSHKISVPIISCMGTGNKLDPTAFEVTDIYKTSVCPLARVMRAELRKRGVPSLKVVYSREEPRRAVKDSSLPPASISFVPSAAGLIIASTVVKDIINGDLQRA